MKVFNIIGILFWATFANCYSSGRTDQPPKMVKVRFHAIFNFVDSINDVTDYYDDAWYKDSFLIFKCNQVRLIDNVDTSRKRAILETRNYSFINLRNYHCQDYLLFSDSTAPVSNYYVDISDTTHNLIFRLQRNPASDTSKMYFNRIADTIEKGVKYKRYQAFKTYADNFIVRIVTYIGLENYPKYFFQSGLLSTNIKLRKNEAFSKTYNYHANKIESILSTENLTNQISAYDEKVFATWKENNAHPTLPLISGKEASKILSDTLFKLDIKKAEKFQQTPQNIN